MKWKRFYLAIGLVSPAWAAHLTPESQSPSQASSPSRHCRSNLVGPLSPNDADLSCPPVIDDKTPGGPDGRGPWASQPTCINTTDGRRPKLCVYLRGNFRGGPGSISVVTTPETAAETAHLFEDQDRAWLRHAMGYELRAAEPPPCVVREVAGKGRGVVARRDIGAGEIVMVEYPVFLRPLDFGQWPAKGRELLGLLSVGGNQLPVAERWKIMKMARSGTGDMLDDVFNTNSYAVAFGGADYSALFPDVAVRNLGYHIQPLHP